MTGSICPLCSRFFTIQLQRYLFIRIDLNRQQVRNGLVGIPVRFLEPVFKFNGDACRLFLHSFTGPNVNRNLIPEKVVNPKPRGNKRIGHRESVNPRLFTIGRNGLALNVSSAILTPDDVVCRILFG